SEEGIQHFESAGQDFTFEFESSLSPNGAAELTVNLKGDYDQSHEVASIYIETIYLGQLGGEGSNEYSQTYTVPVADLEAVLSDGLIS
ncbi:MAG: hypothetical protein QGF36_07130, partial [Candidatus Marinimicrobia bacterium]|nr:hypothetical protein [Candidatus Neomarinimicrobiota bacterium]